MLQGLPRALIPVGAVSYAVHAPPPASGLAVLYILGHQTSPSGGEAGDLAQTHECSHPVQACPNAIRSVPHCSALDLSMYTHTTYTVAVIGIHN